MKSVDTNILLCYWLEDDEGQSPLASAIINGSEAVLIPDAVLVEAAWTLSGRKYRLSRERLIETLQSLFAEPCVRFEDPQVIWCALSDFRQAKPYRGKRSSFADALIIHKSRHVIVKLGLSFDGCYTFDLAAQQLPGALMPR